jgi:CubicO group peptidase (beta-lactamase class C family)
MSSDGVRQLVDFGAKNDMDSLLVVRHGKAVVDAYYAPFRPGIKRHIYSATKGVTATLIGIAIRDGLLKSVDQPIMGFFPAERTPKAKVDHQAITLKHVLDMTSGIDWKEPLDGLPESMFQMTSSANWTDFILNRPMARTPGTVFNYNSGNSQLLSAILSTAAGSSADVYAKKRLFGPLGITDVVWRKDPQGHSIGGFGLYMHPRDMAKIGYLYLHNGAWQSERLLPKEWTDKVSQATVDMGMGTEPVVRYANGWWSIPERNVYMAVGFHRQLIVVMPKLDLVVATTGKTHYRLTALIDLLQASATAADALPANPIAHAALLDRVKDVATEKATVVGPTPAIAAQISGRTYQFDSNQLGLGSMVLDLTPTNPRYELLFKFPQGPTGTSRVAGPIGLSGLFAGTEPNSGAMLAVKANWTDITTLSMLARDIAEGTVNTYTMQFSADTVHIGYQSNNGFTAQLRGTVKP